MSTLDKFGEFVVVNLRDLAIEQHDIMATGGWRTPSLQPLQNALASLSEDHRLIVRRCVVKVLDNATHNILHALQVAHDLDEGIEVLVDGENVAELSGMLQGEPLGENGWVARFGKYPPQAEVP